MILIPSTDFVSDNVVSGAQLEELAVCPRVPFDSLATDFLSALSRSLFKDSLAKKFPDAVALAYWCRGSNLKQMKKNHTCRHPQIGRGLAFHVAPANVPLNFAYSLAFGMLAGCANVVRLPSSHFEQLDVVVRHINDLFRSDKYASLFKSNSLVRYQRDDTLTEVISAVADARIIWGGDQTISQIRAMTTKPRCVDICFADRYSLALLNARAVSRANDRELRALVAGFYNDCFTFDQGACSSPHLVLWQGSALEVSESKRIFWDALRSHVDKRESQAVQALIEKYRHLFRVALNIPSSVVTSGLDTTIARMELNQLAEGVEAARGSHGFFLEATDNSFEQLNRIVNGKFQTLTYFGGSKQEVVDMIVDKGCAGIDRVVPVGQALQMGLTWDGISMVDTLTRMINLE